MMRMVFLFIIQILFPIYTYSRRSEERIF
jgi:hypothetical protein